ncbi:MAG: LD-carboxypeptidase [Minisyncoccia bacterium]
MKINNSNEDVSIGVIAPARPIYNIQKEIDDGITEIKSFGFNVKKSNNLNKKLFYSAGTVEERVSDIHEMFSDKKVKAIICATGGASSNQLIEHLDFDLIKKNLKIFMGYSDITALLLAINKKTSMPTFYGPMIRDFAGLTDEAKKFTEDLLKGKSKNLNYLQPYKTLRKGKVRGKLVGGVLTVFNSLLATPYMPDLKGKILFWEEVGTCPAQIDFLLQELKLAGVFKKIKGMVVGYLSDCTDKKYPQDNRSIDEIILGRTKGFDFPIIKVDYFGHDVKNFLAIPIGTEAIIDTNKKIFSVKL